MIKECLANIECKVIDIVKKHNIVVLEAVAAYIDTARKEKRTVHAVGDGTFIVDGRRLDRREMMAAKLPDKKNIEVFTPGVPRQVVLAEMGLPSSYEDRNGVRSEVYKFKQGYSREAKISRAVFHGTADLFTWGLWEAVGTPTEYYFSGTDILVLVTYDRDDRVSAVEYFSGGEKAK